MEVPKPDYSQLRRSIPGHEKTLDPRLRRILRLRDDPIDSEMSLPASGKPAHGSELEISSPPHIASALSSPSESLARPRMDPRSDPRRAAASNKISTATNPAPTVLNPSNAQRSLQLDIQNILQKSDWYKDCSSKQKIMVNQQLAIVSTELKKFHADPSDSKIFDLAFISQNSVLQEVLTNLGIFISDNGEFVQLDKSGCDVNIRSAGGVADLMSLPLRSNLDMSIDFLRNQQQQQQHQQQAMQQAMSAMNAQPLGSSFPSSILAFRNSQPDVIRPGLLGIAPNMPFPGNFEQYFNRNVPTSNSDNRNNYRGSGGGSGNSGNRWAGGSSNNSNRDSSARRNQYDRNSSRRDKK